MPFWAQAEMWYARRVVHAILFAYQKNRFSKNRRKIMKKNETCMKFREESISDHPVGQK